MLSYVLTDITTQEDNISNQFTKLICKCSYPPPIIIDLFIKNFNKKRSNMRNQGIFIEENSSNYHDIDQISYDSSSVGRFLVLQPQLENQEMGTKQKSTQGSESSSSQESIDSEIGEKTQEQKQMTSNFHNFPKHTVVTMQKLQTPKKLKLSPELYPIEDRLWKIFKKSRKRTKTLVYLVIFGIGSMGKPSLRNIRRYGLEKLNKQYSPQQIMSAQDSLREMILEELCSLDLSLQLSERKMEKKEEFKEYFRDFVGEMQRGIICKRTKYSDGFQDSFRQPRRNLGSRKRHY